MSKRRSINTHFWSDNYIIELEPIDKLLFLYLLTNEKTNMLGIYELHIRKISFDTGIDKERIAKGFEAFAKGKKALYVDGYVVLRNFTKHQSYNNNMKKSALNSFKELPLEVRKHPFCKPLLKGLEPLPKGFEPIAEIETEIEREIETEGETESYGYGCSEKWEENQQIDHTSFVEAFNELYDRSLRVTDQKREMIRGRLRTFTGEEIQTAWENRLEDDWLNGDGKKFMDNWKAAMRNDEKIEQYLKPNDSDNGLLDQNPFRQLSKGMQN